MCRAERQGMAARRQVLQGLLCPTEFGLYPLGQRVWWLGKWGRGQKGETRSPPDDLETSPGPFQTLAVHPSRVGGRAVIVEMVQSVKDPWGDWGPYFSVLPLTLENHLALQWKAREDFSGAGTRSVRSELSLGLRCRRWTDI